MIHPIPPGLFCVPAALVAITGAPVDAVIVPAINRHTKAEGLLDTVAGIRMSIAKAVLDELGYVVRSYKRSASSGPLRVQVRTWAARSLHWRNRPVLVATRTHCLVVHNGMVHDNWEPRGVLGSEHPYARTQVEWGALIEKRG